MTHSGHHQKIRFRRDEIADLGSFPSACDQPEPPVRTGRRPSPGRRRRGVGAAVALVSLLGIVIAVGLFSTTLFDFGAERMRIEAEKAMQRLTGSDVIASHGRTGLSFDRSSLLAVEINDVGFVRAHDRAPLLTAGTVRFELRVLPLLRGKVELGGAMIADATIDSAVFPKFTGADWAAPLRNGDGLIDPDRVLQVAFAGVGKGLDIFAKSRNDTVELSNVSIELPAALSGKSVTIAHAALTAPQSGRMDLSLEGALDGRRFSLTGDAARDEVSRRITDLKLGLGISSMETVVADSEGAAMPSTPTGNQVGAINLSLAGAEGIGNTASSIKAAAMVDNVGIDFGRFGVLNSELELGTTLEANSDKLEIDKLLVATGRSRMNFNGAIGLAPPTANGAHLYRFELVSRDSTLAPADSPEPALAVGTRVAGTFDPKERRLYADQIELSGGAGQALGTVAVDFVPGKAPGIALALSATDMPLAHIKQIWPWFSGPPARRWVLGSVFGGTVVDSRVVLRVPPGRLGNGVPLNGDEVFGSATVDATRFDVSGQIPPVRDAHGTVSFRGPDVDVVLDSGTIYLPSGRTVAGRNGELTIRDANKRPVIGKLDIDVKGDAPAVAELSAYEPMNALSKINLAAEDFSGTVEGHVRADIPMHSGIPRESLDWRVAFKYQDLALSKPFEGQLLTDADGTITVEKTSAVIDAKGKLNGVPAELALIEPLVPSGPKRSQHVVLALDNKARKQLAPGLDGMLSGPVKLEVDALPDGRKDMSADLTGATLTLPWANWTKGPGIPAKVSFVMDTARNGGVTLSDVDLSGATFAAKGTVRLSGGSLESADISNARLNRGDDASIKIKRAGKGYAIDIRGSSLDARALIKRYVASGDMEEQAPAPGGPVPVTLKLNVASLGGFGDERLSGVSFSYSGNGSESGAFQLDATTDGGGQVSAVNTVDEASRRLTVKSGDAGALVRFLDIYEHMQGGQMNMALSGPVGGALKGQVEARNFYVVDEPRIRSLVATPPPGSDRSLNEVVRSDVDVTRAQFERGFAVLDKGDEYLKIENGVLRGPLIGSTFQGTLYDARGRMDMTGTFMPAYGLNRIFGELPIIGDILGNGRDRGLIGVTYRLSGKAGSPNLEVNPLSVIAPGIFRSIFEY